MNLDRLSTTSTLQRNRPDTRPTVQVDLVGMEWGPSPGTDPTCEVKDGQRSNSFDLARGMVDEVVEVIE